MPKENKSETNDDNGSEVDELAEFREQDYEDRITAYKDSLGIKNEDEITQSQRDKELARVLVPLLAMQCYHLPGNTFWQDWRQYVGNNHPIFGICCHHRLHPLGAKTRIIALIGTLVFGLALTSFFELLYIKYPKYQHEIWVVDREGEEPWILTSAMLSLWTVGGGIHTGYNLFMWHIAACSCMREGGCMESAKCCNCPQLGKSFMRIFAFITIALSVFVILFKVIIANDESTEIDDVGKVADLDNYSNAEDFGFILAYLVGMALSFFFWYFVGAIVLMSGVLGCGRLPVLGGRPREVAIEKRLLEKKKIRDTYDEDDDYDEEQPSSPMQKKKKKKSRKMMNDTHDEEQPSTSRSSPGEKKTKKKKKNSYNGEDEEQPPRRSGQGKKKSSPRNKGTRTSSLVFN